MYRIFLVRLIQTSRFVKSFETGSFIKVKALFSHWDGIRCSLINPGLVSEDRKIQVKSQKFENIKFQHSLDF